MTKRESEKEWWLADVTTSDHGEILVAFRHHRNIKGSVHVVHASWRDQCLKLADALKRIDHCLGYTLDINDDERASESNRIANELVEEAAKALAEFRKWKEQK